MKQLLLLALAPLLVCAADLKIGIVGTDTEHCIAFTEIINNPSAPGHAAGKRANLYLPSDNDGGMMSFMGVAEPCTPR